MHDLATEGGVRQTQKATGSLTGGVAEESPNEATMAFSGAFASRAGPKVPLAVRTADLAGIFVALLPVAATTGLISVGAMYFAKGRTTTAAGMA